MNHLFSSLQRTARRKWSSISKPALLARPPSKTHSTAADGTSSLDVSHSRFIAEAASKERWGKAGINDNGNGVEDEMEGITDTRGKVLPTSSHLFKLVLPLPDIKNGTADLQNRPPTSNHPPGPPTIFLLHPSQPLSHLSRLIASSISPAALNPTISFRRQTSSGNYCQWSDSTDVGDFIRDAARASEFKICISYGAQLVGTNPNLRDDTNPNDVKDPSSKIEESQSTEHTEPSSSSSQPVSSLPTDQETSQNAPGELVITVTVPTFADRTKYLRRRLTYVRQRLEDMEGLKLSCDREAHRGARKMALGGFGMLVVYWGAVARLTFWDFGWDVMEPITYLSGLSTVVLGYLWFLYQGREVSYASVLARSISARRDTLYKARGFNIERWMELITEKKELKSHIAKIASDYEEDELPDDNEEGDKAGGDIKLGDESTLENPKDKEGLVVDLRTGETKI